jgi:hypothetical protein
MHVEPGIVKLDRLSERESLSINRGKFPMKWFKFVLALVILSTSACVSSTGPSMPQDHEDDGTKTDPSKNGQVISFDEGFFV